MVLSILAARLWEPKGSLESVRRHSGNFEDHWLNKVQKCTQIRLQASHPNIIHLVNVVK
jgi:hypothetical protein